MHSEDFSRVLSSLHPLNLVMVVVVPMAFVQLPALPLVVIVGWFQ